MPNPVDTGLPNPMHYTVCGDGAVRDDVTGLVWEQGSTGLGDFTTATNHCQGLSIAGGGWRLPTAIELASLLDFTKLSPSIDTQAFPETPSEPFWTSTLIGKKTDVGPGPGIYSVSFGDSGIGGDRAPPSLAWSRCVRSAATVAPSQPFAQIEPGEVRDSLTGLVWEQKHSPSVLYVADAQAYCAHSTVSRRAAGTWRLPSMKELAALWTFGNVPPDPTAAFFEDSDLPEDACFWSSSATPNTEWHVGLPMPGDNWELRAWTMQLSSMFGAPAFARCVH